MNPKMRFLIAAVVLVGAVGYLMYTGVRQTAVYYLTVHEFLAKKDQLANEGIRVAGTVELGSVTKRMTPKGEELNFRMGDFTGNGKVVGSVPVHFVGITPDMFKDAGGSNVIVEGKYRDGTIYAHSVLTSCPSKYQAKDAGKSATRGPMPGAHVAQVASN